MGRVKIHTIHLVQHDDTGKAGSIRMGKVMGKKKNTKSGYLNTDLVDFKVKLQGTKGDII